MLCSDELRNKTLSNLILEDKKLTMTLRESFDKLLAVHDHSKCRSRWDGLVSSALDHPDYPLRGHRCRFAPAKPTPCVRLQPPSKHKKASKTRLLVFREIWDGLRTFEWRKFRRFLEEMEVFVA